MIDNSIGGQTLATPAPIRPGPRPDTVAAMELTVRRAIAHMEARLSDGSLHVNDIAKAVAYSYGRLSQFFLEVVGTTPKRYLVLLRVQAAIAYMKAHLNNVNLEVGDIAKAVGYHGIQFNSVFQQVTGSSPMRYLTLLRMKKAMELLRSTSLTAAAICYQVGYASFSGFSNRFKRTVGVTPTQYRRGEGADELLLGEAATRPAPVMHDSLVA